MSNLPVRVVLGAVCLFGACVAGCGGDGARNFGGPSGGATGQGGGTAGTSGTGGVGGASGGGGAFASGGHIGTGGQAMGGNNGTGGRGTGGSGTTGGVRGSGGAGSGGRVGSTGGAVGTGGGTGSGGTGGANPALCDQIATQYQNEMPAAKTCALNGTTQCQTLVASSLGCGMSCTIYVQDATALGEILQRWNAANCNSIPRICPAIACVNPQRGQCGLMAGSTVPQCLNGLPIATD